MTINKIINSALDPKPKLQPNLLLLQFNRLHNLCQNNGRTKI